MFIKKLDHDDFDVIISCGRKSVIPSIHLKNTANKKVFNIHIQDPKVDLNHFDFIVAPEHDALEVKMLLIQRVLFIILQKMKLVKIKIILNHLLKKMKENLDFNYGWSNKVL